MKNRVTSLDVAKEAGVSRSTVSLVLNGKMLDRIPDSTQKRVMEAARQLSYIGNASARALVTGRTGRIGIVLNHPQGFRAQSSYHTRLMEGITAAALSRRYDLLLHTAYQPDWRAFCQSIMSGSADGTIMVGDYPVPDLEETLAHSHYPVVFISHSPGASCISVDCDNVSGGDLAARHLLQLGRKRLVYLKLGKFQWQERRQEGIRRVVQAAGDSEVSLTVINYKDVDDAANQILKMNPRPDGAILATEEPGISIIHELIRKGVRIPADLSFINFNSTDYSSSAPVAITSVWQPLFEIGGAAFDLVADKIEGLDPPPGERIYPVRLDIRSSCGAAIGGLPKGSSTMWKEGE